MGEYLTNSTSNININGDVSGEENLYKKNGPEPIFSLFAPFNNLINLWSLLWKRNQEKNKADDSLPRNKMKWNEDWNNKMK